MPKPETSILDFATPEEAKAIRALEAHGSNGKAATALGITKGALRDRVRRATRRAASRGWSPAHDWKHPVPEGHRVRGNSTLYGADGSVEGQWVKSERDSDEPSAFAAVPEGHLVNKVSTLLDGQGKVRAQWLQAPKDEQTRWDQFWAACERNVARYKGAAEPASPPAFSDEETCTVYPLGDPHIGMLSWGAETGQDFDLQIAERDLIRAVDLLVDRAPASHLAILANVGDFFHAEDDAQRTPASGHKLDCDTRSAKITDVGFRIMRHLIDRLLVKHGMVRVVNVPGNHDPRTSRMMNMWLEAVYEREPRVFIEDNRNPYIYITHGRNLLGFAHGDGAKPEALPGIMAADRPAEWGCTDYRLWVTGHVHHQTRKEYPGCVVESFRTLAARDYWHAWKGYRSGQSLSCITLHESYGELTRSTVDIKLVRSQ
jgi:UDP-2,3-diacylglucosamine pyrophosphatase LpxH